MTNEIKMTQKMAIAYVLENVTTLPEDVKGKLTEIGNALEKKSNSKSDKPSATQLENAKLKATLLEKFADKRYTATEVIKTFEDFADFSNQKVSRLLNDLVNEGKMDKITEKSKTYFFVK